MTPPSVPVRASPGRRPRAHGHMTDRTGHAGQYQLENRRSGSVWPLRSKRSVKPSAQPTQVRTLDLPPPAQTARDRGMLQPRGPSRVVSSPVIRGQQTPLYHAGYGHIADGFGAEGAVHRTACSAGGSRSPALNRAGLAAEAVRREQPRGYMPADRSAPFPRRTPCLCTPACDCRR